MFVCFGLSRLDESSESLLSFFHELSDHPSHPRSRVVLFECARSLALWLAEDSDACDRAEVHHVLPFLLGIKDPSSPSSSPSSSLSSPVEGTHPTSVLALLLPALLFLSSNPDAQRSLREENVAARLVQEVIFDTFALSIEKQMGLLVDTAASSSASSAESASMDSDERAEIRSALARQMGHALVDIGNACAVLHNLCVDHNAALQKQVKPVWAQLQPLLNTCVKLSFDQALQSSGLDLEESVAAMNQVIDLATRKIGKGAVV